jgi:hypothetical protein
MSKFDNLYESIMNEAQNDKVLQQIAGLSSGTLGSLTGLVKYRELDKVAADFYKFIKNASKKFDNWSDAWDYYGLWYPEVNNWNLSQDKTKAEYVKGDLTLVIDKSDYKWNLYRNDDVIDAGETKPSKVKDLLRQLMKTYKK